MTSKFSIKRFAALFAAAAMTAGAFTSCVTDEYSVDGNPVPASGDLTIRIAVPGNSRPSTRALDTFDEYDVKEIAVLAFDADDKEFYGRYAGSFSGTPAHQSGTEAGATMTFSVSLPLGEFDLMVVANANSILNAASATLVRGTAQNIVSEAIKMTMGTTGWDVDASPAPLPMWGYKTGVNVPEDFTGTGTTLSSAIRLTRMVAKVDIKLGTDLIAADKFELQTVRVYNYVEQGRLIPAPLSDWEDGDDVTLNDTPTLPAGYTKADAASNEYIEYTLGQDETSLVRSIYLFESPAGISPVSDLTGGMKNTCLVIGGSYNGGTKSWYRIDFTKDTDPNTADDVHNWVYMPILRNNVYFITVTDITGDGYGSASDALGSAPVNINTSVLDWANDNIHVVGTNGIYMLGISQDAFEFTPDAQTTASTGNKLTVVTDYSGGWTATVWDDEAGTIKTATSSWLTLSKSSVAAADDPDGTEVSLLATANTGAGRMAWVHVTAGVITLKIKVMQAVMRYPGVFAPPGVIGYIKGTNTLTIRGSKEFLGTPVMTDPNNTNITTSTTLATGEPLEDATVYVALFKFGSLVATSTEVTTIVFDPATDIVTWPTEWAADRTEMENIVGTSLAGASWPNIPFVSLPGQRQELMVDGKALDKVSPEQGTGDACIYWADKLGWGTGWRLPAEGPNTQWHYDGGSPFGEAAGSFDTYWPPAGGYGPGAAFIDVEGYGWDTATHLGDTWLSRRRRGRRSKRHGG